MKISSKSIEEFVKCFVQIDKPRIDFLKNTANTELKSDLLKNGITIVKNVFSKNELSDLVNFQNNIENFLLSNNQFNCGGYVNFQVNKSGISAYLDKVVPNHGQIRVQTKNMPFEMPGFYSIINHNLIKEIFSWWYNVENSKITRGSLEWIIPAPYNHNGWHKDMVRPQLKAFVFLGNVDNDTAPMYYAKGSHFINNEFEKNVAYRLFKEGTHVKSNYLNRKGNHYPAAIGAHSGFLSDDEALNDPKLIDNEPTIKLGGFEYEKFVCTGEFGDVIFFDSCGFHSGNISNGKIRRTISLSAPDIKTAICSALDEQGVKTA